MSSILRPWYSRSIPADATRCTHKGKPAVRFKGGDGKPVVGYPIEDKPGSCRVQSRTYYAQLRDAQGNRQRVSLEVTDKEAAQQALGKLIDFEDDKRRGRGDPFAEQSARPLAHHLTEWEAALRSSGATEKHIGQSSRIMDRILHGCEFVFVADLQASRLQSFIATMREARSDVDDSPALQAEYTKTELAKLVGLKASALPSLVRRHGLEAIGKGKARRFPASTALALLRMRASGKSIKTANGYLSAAKAFVAWMVRDRRTEANPFEHLEGGNPETDRRHERRFLAVDEVRRLINAAGSNDQEFRGLSGPDRAMLYTTAIYTGFRAGELAQLVPASFDLDAATPLVRLSPSQTKNRKGAEQPIPLPFVPMLRDYIAGKPSGQPVWPGSWYLKAADMMRLDLDAAGLAFSVAGPGGRLLHADFHSLRSTCGILAEQGGASLREVMTLLRHSDPKLTMRTYGRLQIHDLAKTVGGMPSLNDIQTESHPTRTTTAQLSVNLVPDGALPCTSEGLSPATMPLPQTLDLPKENVVLPSEMTDSESSPTRTRTWNKPVNSRLLYH